MKILAIILNIILIVIFIILLVDDWGHLDIINIIHFSFLFSIPLINIFVIMSIKSNSWLYLYIKRKALEEQKKIEALTKK